MFTVIHFAISLLLIVGIIKVSSITFHEQMVTIYTNTSFHLNIENAEFVDAVHDLGVDFTLYS